MSKVVYILGLVMLCCSSVCADIQRELQHEINYINILLSDPDWSDLEKEYLRTLAMPRFFAKYQVLKKIPVEIKDLFLKTRFS